MHRFCGKGRFRWTGLMERTLICSVQLSKTGAPTDRELELLRIHVSTSSGVALSACDVKNLSIHRQAHKHCLATPSGPGPSSAHLPQVAGKGHSTFNPETQEAQEASSPWRPWILPEGAGVSKGLRIGPCDQVSASDEESTTAPPSDVTTPPATTTPTTTMPTTTTVPGRKSL